LPQPWGGVSQGRGATKVTVRETVLSAKPQPENGAAKGCRKGSLMRRGKNMKEKRRRKGDGNKKKIKRQIQGVS